MLRSTRPARAQPARRGFATNSLVADIHHDKEVPWHLALEPALLKAKKSIQPSLKAESTLSTNSSVQTYNKPCTRLHELSEVIA